MSPCCFPHQCTAEPCHSSTHRHWFTLRAAQRLCWPPRPSACGLCQWWWLPFTCTGSCTFHVNPVGQVFLLPHSRTRPGALRRSHVSEVGPSPCSYHYILLTFNHLPFLIFANLTDKRIDLTEGWICISLSNNEAEQLFLHSRATLFPYLWSSPLPVFRLDDWSFS